MVRGEGEELDLWLSAFALTCRSAPCAWVPLTFRHRQRHPAPRDPFSSPLRGLAPVWEAGWAEVQRGAFWWLLVPWSTSQPGARAGSQSHPLPASGLSFYSPLWVLIP